MMGSPPTQADGTEDPLPCSPHPRACGPFCGGSRCGTRNCGLSGVDAAAAKPGRLDKRATDCSPFWNTLIFYEGLSAQESTERREAGGGVNGQWLPQAQRGEAWGTDGRAGGGDPAWGSLNTDLKMVLKR